MPLDPGTRDALVAAHPSLARSIDVYLAGDAAREAAMDRLLARFAAPGRLVFDVGAHVGDRVRALRRLGARVVAVEPQPACAALLRVAHADDVDVTVVEAACGARAGRASLAVNTANPTVSTLSSAFVDATRGAAGWEGQSWDAVLEVPVVTLDELVVLHGVPSFVKIDVEGFEVEVLRGLAHPLPALSFEVTTVQREVAVAALHQLAALAPYRFDLSLGETHALVFGAGHEVGLDEMARFLRALPHEANSGDVYAVRAG